MAGANRSYITDLVHKMTETIKEVLISYLIHLHVKIGPDQQFSYISIEEGFLFCLLMVKELNSRGDCKTCV